MRTALEFHDTSFGKLKVTSHLVSAGVWKDYFMIGRVICLTEIVMFLFQHGWTAYQHRDNALEVIESQSLMCTGIILMVKYYSMIHNRVQIRQLTEYIRAEVYVRYGESCPEYPVVLKYGRVLHMAAHIMIWGYIVSLGIIELNPLFMYLTEGRLVLIFFNELPYVDWTTTRGYWITIAWQLLICLTGLCALILVDYMCAFFTTNGLLLIDVMRYHLEELGRALALPKSPEVLEDIHRKWRECLMEHQHIVEYFENFSNLWSLINLAHVGCGVLGICINMLLLLLVNWYAAYPLIFALFVDLSIYFLMGAIIEGKVDELHLSLLHFPWHLLDDRRQKEYNLLLLRSEQPCGLSIAGITPVNYETYTKIMKMLYQLFALARNFLK